MSKFKLQIFLIVLLPMMIIILWKLYATKDQVKKEFLGVNTAVNIKTHPSKFFEKQAFSEGVAFVKRNNPTEKTNIRGGVIPHHLFPGFIIADFFHRLKMQNPDTVILIGPNHYERGDSKVLTSVYGWNTPFGVVQSEDKIIRELTAKQVLKVDDHVLENDHAVAGIIPFIKYYLPATKVVPILLSGFMNEDETRFLASQLESYVNKDTVLVAAVDFSHYLVNKEAQEKDKVTLNVIKKYDYRQLFTLDNDYLDSPPAIAVLLLTMQKLGMTKMDILHHTNSGELQKDDYIETTSYFSIIFH